MLCLEQNDSDLTENQAIKTARGGELTDSTELCNTQ